MKQIFDFLNTMPATYSAFLAPILIFIFFYIKFEKVRSLIKKFLPNRNGKIVKVLDLILQESFESINRVNNIKYQELRYRRKQILEESRISVYMMMCGFFDEEMKNTGEGRDFVVEKMLFEAVSMLLLRATSSKITESFEDRDIIKMSDSAFRAWSQDVLLNIKNSLDRKLHNCYPDKDLILPRAKIEALVLKNKSDIKDAFYQVTFKIRDLEKELNDKITKEKIEFKSHKEKIFKDFLEN